MNYYKHFENTVVHELKKPTFNINGDSFATTVKAVMIVLGMNDSFIQNRKAINVKSFLIDDYGISEENFNYLTGITSKPIVFFGAEWSLFQNEVAEKIETHLPWHLIAKLYTDVNLGITNDFRVDKIKSKIFNNENKRQYELHFDDYETMYEMTKIYIGENYMLEVI
jgi:hypothetical protein